MLSVPQWLGVLQVSRPFLVCSPPQRHRGHRDSTEIKQTKSSWSFIFLLSAFSVLSVPQWLGVLQVSRPFLVCSPPRRHREHRDSTEIKQMKSDRHATLIVAVGSFSSQCILSVLSASVVGRAPSKPTFSGLQSTTETQRTQRQHGDQTNDVKLIHFSSQCILSVLSASVVGRAPSKPTFSGFAVHHRDTENTETARRSNKRSQVGLSFFFFSAFSVFSVPQWLACSK